MGEPMGAWAAAVDRDACIGSGMCVVYAPLTFSHDGEAKAIAKQPPGEDLETVRAAVEACPMGALTLVVGDEGV